MEFWHYQYTGNLSWYDAMREVYPSDVLETYFSWEELRERDIPLWTLRAKGIPIPPNLRAAPAEIVIP
ncbi:MAG: hypothetical protein ACRDIB_16185, partial [Ardenticatenaceae bacterium]